MKKEISVASQNCNAKYAFINAAMYAGGLCYNGFGTTYLLSVGFTAAQIGVLYAAGSISGIFMQSVFSTWVDKSRKVTLTMIEASQILLTIVLLIAMATQTKAGIITACAFVLITCTYATKQSFVNGIGLWYIGRGAKLNYGVPRGIGSVSYALMSLLVGELASRVGCFVIPVLAIVMEVLFLTAIFLMPTRPREGGKARELSETVKDKKITPPEGNSSEGGEGLGFFAFCIQNPSFTVLIIGMILVGISINNLGVYGINIVQDLGGDASDYGILCCVSAMVEFPAMAAYRSLEKKFSCRTLILFAIFAYFLKVCGYALAPNLALLCVAASLQMLSYAIFTPACLSFVKLYIREQDSNKALGLMTSYYFAGGVIGSPIGGLIVNRFGIRTLLYCGMVIAAIGVATAMIGVVGATRTDAVKVREAKAGEAKTIAGARAAKFRALRLRR